MTRTLKSCSCCGRSAESSLSLLISTLSVTPRKQLCSKSVPLCAVCIQDLFDSNAAQHSTEKLRQTLKNAYTAINALIESDQHDDTSER